MKLYSTVVEEGHAEQIIEKSRFIAYVKPVSEREEAERFIAEIRKKHKDATHNVPAMVIGDKFQLQWASDDGEPQGTSGAPMVQMLVKEGITNVVVVVTRYFGGIKLGTGGLVRAYTSSAKLGLEAAGICDVMEQAALTYRVDYSAFNRVQNFSFGYHVELTGIEYTDTVTFSAVLAPENAESFREQLVSLTAGCGVLTASSVQAAAVRR